MTETEKMTAAARAGIAAEWWRDLHGHGESKEDRASLARLRRAGFAEAARIAAVHALYRRLWEGGDFREKRLALTLRVALVLAHVREEERGEPGQYRAFGASLGAGETPALHPLRFRQLLQARGDEEIVRDFRRAVALNDHRADLRSLALLMLTWDEDATRTRFAFDYFQAGMAAPAAAT
ncbi:type I-E CRISPR-associated protein Cse2/CasB [Rhizobium paknamense]|uniref:CRISPR system Cascade subunit CasB n=1 Tax=Rhizobium paknamense TaxID=1206817 RepID=A0ABU0IBV8_9HYPH|nr:type I-E CRISPR-associated protein Cse2/CasB [Rhizobium paknamense]MDQ0455719.1 CRISPR system Cascade subunit CasB [Rhizobium paknamense]